jgi:hypothetical protein
LLSVLLSIGKQILEEFSPSAPYQRRTTNRGIETLYYCADFCTQAMVEIEEEGDVKRGGSGQVNVKSAHPAPQQRT